MPKKTNLPAQLIDVSEVAQFIKNPLGLIEKLALQVGVQIIRAEDAKGKGVYSVINAEPIIDHDWCRTAAATIAKSKKPVIDESKRLASEAKIIVDADIAFRNEFEAAVDAIQSCVRKPLTDAENKEKERIAKHKSAISQLSNMSVFDGFSPSSEQLQERCEAVKAIDTSGLEEFAVEAESVKTALIANLSQKYIAVKAQEDKDAELERLQLEDEKRKEAERVENEAKAARLARLKKLQSIPEQSKFLTIEGLKAKLASVQNSEIAVDNWLEQYAPAVNAKIEVVATLEKMIVDAEKIEADKAERIAREASEKAKKRAEDERLAKEAAERKVKEDAERAERERTAKEQAEIDRQARIEAERKSDTENRRIKNNDAAEGFVKLGFADSDAKAIITAIANGEIPHVCINY